jgi:ubiquitin-conjugating enzyme E2 J2
MSKGKVIVQPTDACLKRLRKEYVKLVKEPVPFIQAVPLESNILEWHYCITGAPGTPYEGGSYHGKVVFPPEYPYKPPSIMMITPNGRFQTNTRLCLSISDFHPEEWSCLWSVGTILSGLLSFMVSFRFVMLSLKTDLFWC